jgi:hypothetical protein
MALTGTDLEIHNMFAALRDLDFDKLEQLTNETSAHPNNMIYTARKYNVCCYSGGCVIMNGYSLFTNIAHNLRHIRQRTPSYGDNIEWNTKRWPQLKRIMIKLKEKGQDLEVMRFYYNNDGSIFRNDEEHTRALAICIDVDDNAKHQCVEFLLELGCRLDNYTTSHCTVHRAISDYPHYELLYTLIKYGADVNQPWQNKNNWKPITLDYYNRTYKKYFDKSREQAEKFYGKKITDDAFKVKKLLEQGKSHVDRIEREKREAEERERHRVAEEERKKQEEHELKKKAAEKAQREAEELRKNRQKEAINKTNIVTVIGTGTIITKEKQPVQVPVPNPEPETKPELYNNNDKEAGSYLILAMNNIMYITEYGKYLPEEFNKQMHENIAQLFATVKHKMSKEALENVKPQLPDYCHKFL